MRKFMLLTLVIVLIFIMTGCSEIARSKIEIDDAIFVRVLSIDKGENNNVKVTITSKNVTAPSNGSDSSNTQGSYSITAEGKTMAEAVRSLWAYADRRPYYGHAEFILIGEEAAKEGLFKYIDYISRDHQFRHSSKLYIVKGTSANSLVENAASGNLFIGDRLMNLEGNAVGMSISSRVTLAEAMFIFDNPNVSTFIPCLEQFKTAKIVNGDINNYNIELSGYAIFKGDKLNRYLLHNEARGINWIKNRIASGMIIVKGNKGEDISLEIIRNETRIKPKITDDKLYCDISISVNTNIDEITAPDKIFNKESIDYLVLQQNEVIKKEIQNVLKIAQKSNLDFFGIIQEFHMKYPVMWKDIEKNWSSLFPEINFNVTVNSKINRTYLIKEPTGTIK